MTSPTERKRKGMDRSNMADGETESNHGDDVSSMQIQALRSLFLLLVLAVTILVVFSSLAVLRKPKLSPNVNVFVGVATGNDVDDSARLKRGVEIPLVHTPTRRKKLSNTVSRSKGHKEQGMHKPSQGHNKNVTKSVKRKDSKGRNITHVQVDVKHGVTVNRTHKQTENITLPGRLKEKHSTKWAGPVTKQEVTSLRKPKPSKYSSRHNL